MQKTEKKIKEIEQKILENRIRREKNFLITEMKKIGIEKLPYSYSALKSFIDAETMNFHYNKHYKGYVEKLNDALSKKKTKDNDLEKIVQNISRYDTTVRNNAGGAFNHALFWNMLTPKSQKLTGELYTKITNQFGTFNNFKKKFENIAKQRFGSGWVWLVLGKNGKLKIMSTPNQDNPLMNVVENGGFPLLGLDLWEHAYYLKYKNKRDDYISNFWKVVNWDFVKKLYELKTKTNLLESEEMRRALSVESKPSFCSSEESQLYKSIRENPAIKDKYREGIDNILKSKFPQFYRNNQRNQMPGFYDFEKEGARSVLSNLNSNNAAFCLLVQAVNNQLDKINRQEKKFNFWNTENQTKEVVEKFLIALNYFKDQIFNPDNPDFVNIIRVLVELWNRGVQTEDETVEKIKKFFKDRAVVTKVGGPGVPMDIQGIDATIEMDGNLLTAQIKPFSFAQRKDNKIKIKSSSSSGPYNVDWLIFYHPKNKNIMIFRNNPITTGEYVFNTDSLIYEIK